MSDEEQMRKLAENFWAYIKPKIDKMMSSSVSYFKAEVEESANGGKIKVRIPLEDLALDLPYAASAENLKPGDACLVLCFGSRSNAKIIGKADLSTL